MYYINVFFVYSFMGFLFENVLNIFTGDFFNSGILYGPWTFIYGIAVLIIMLINKLMRQLKCRKWLKIFIFYIIMAIVMSFIEFMGGFLIEKILHKVYWNYTNLTFNLGKYISLEVALAWGLLATIFNYLIIPKLERFIKKIPWYITIIFGVLFISDIVLTIIY